MLDLEIVAGAGFGDLRGGLVQFGLAQLDDGTDAAVESRLRQDQGVIGVLQ